MIKKTNALVHSIFTPANFTSLLGIQNTLGILTIFSSPLPIPPKTSIGILTGFSMVVVLFLVVFWKKKMIRKIRKTETVDWLVLGYVFANALSLIASPYIFDPTNFRLLLVATIQYVAVRLIELSTEEKHRLLHFVGITTVFVALISLFQLVFRDQAIVIAKRFLFGDAAYSIAWDLGRGRGPQWGNAVIAFPLFVASVLLLRSKKDFIIRLYTWSGIFLIPFSFITTNFRWLTLCFSGGLFFMLFMFVRYKMTSWKSLRRLLAPALLSVIVGMTIASSVFQYNLIDRFLLKEKSRDVVFTLGRLFLYKQAMYAFTASPIVGIGTGNYKYIIDRPVILHYYNFIVGGESEVDTTTREPVSSHNDLLTILAETGALGVVLYTLINYFVFSRLVFLLRKAVVARSQHKTVLWLSIITAISLFHLIGLFENTSPNNLTYLFFLFAVSLTWFQDAALES